MTLSKRLSFVLLILFLSVKAVFALDDKNYNNKLQIINGKDGKIITDFKVKVAQEISDQEKGLMFLEHLPDNYGFLFIFPQERVANIWMKNTLISLDIMFIDKNNKIVKIVSNATPLSSKIISSDYSVKRILEINGSLAKRMEIKVGDKVRLVK